MESRRSMKGRWNLFAPIALTILFVSSPFALAAGTITVTYPNGGEVWEQGSAQTIQWTYTGTPGANVKIELYRNGAFNRFIVGRTSIGNDGKGSYTWTVPKGQKAGSKYKVKVSSTKNSSITDRSDQNFTIIAADPGSSITITSPNGGETWRAGSVQTIRWSFSGNPGTGVRIELLRGGKVNQIITSDTSIGTNGSGSYSWTVPVSQVAGADYKIRVTSTSNASYTDTSDRCFKVVAVNLSEWPNTVSFANSDPWLAEHHNEITVMRPRILALNFVNHKSMAEMREHMEQAIRAIAEGSRYHGYNDPDAPAFLQYELAYTVDLRDQVIPPGYPYRNSTLYPREKPVEGYWGFDYERLFTPEFTQLYNIPDPDDPSRLLSLCELIDRGLVHEVWIYCDGDVPDVSMAEILELKPYYDENRNRLPGPMNRCAGNGCFDVEDDIPCNRTVRIAGFNNMRGVGCYLESLSHGIESTGAWSPSIPYLSRYFRPFAGFDLDTRYGLPFNSWYASSYDRYTLSYPTETSVTYYVQGNRGTVDPYDPICGNVHFAPNARKHYDLDSPYAVRTSCTHYRDGSGQTELFTRSDFESYLSLAPDCMGGFLIWWRQNIPGLNNTAFDDDGNPMLNWWPFLFY